MNWPTDFVEANAILAAVCDWQDGDAIAAYRVDDVLVDLTPEMLAMVQGAAEILVKRCGRLMRHVEQASHALP